METLKGVLEAIVTNPMFQTFMDYVDSYGLYVLLALTFLVFVMLIYMTFFSQDYPVLGKLFSVGIPIVNGNLLKDLALPKRTWYGHSLTLPSDFDVDKMEGMISIVIFPSVRKAFANIEAFPDHVVIPETLKFGGKDFELVTVRND